MSVFSLLGELFAAQNKDARMTTINASFSSYNQIDSNHIFLIRQINLDVTRLYIEKTLLFIIYCMVQSVI